MKVISFCILWLANFNLTAQINLAPDYPPVVLTGSKFIQFKSAVNHHDYTLSVQLPGSYSEDRSRKYPVLYVLDGQWSFAPTIGLLGGLNYDKLVQEVIVVAIGWPDKFDSARTRDLTPTKISDDPMTGGAPAFLQVITKEVMQFVNTNYRVDSLNSILSGGSYGGLFALYVLFNQPSLFQAYIIGSPSLEYDNNLPSQYEKIYATKNDNLKAKVFFHWGQFEQEFYPTKIFDNFVEQLRKRNYKGLEIERLVVDKMSHASNGPYGSGRGLQFVLSHPEVVVERKVLDEYAGKYEHDIAITHQDGHLYLMLAGFKAKFVSITQNVFFIPGLPGIGEFVRDTKGKVVSYGVRVGATTMFAKKIN